MPPSHPTQLNPTQQPQYFCYLYIRQLTQSYISIFLLIIGLVLLAKSIKQYKLSKQADTINFYIKLTYISIFISVTFYLIKIVFSQVIFFVQFSTQEDRTTYELYSRISRYVFVIDIIGIFAMQTSILLVPTNWFYNIIHIFENLSQFNVISAQQTLQLQSSIKFQKTAFKFLKFYQIVRALIFVALLITFSVVGKIQALQIVTKIIFIWFETQPLFVLIILVMGLLSVNNNQKLNQMLEPEDITLMKNHYNILILCTSIRLLTQLLFTILNFNEIAQNQRCFIDKAQSFNIWEVVNLLFQGLLTHYLSIFAILRIYKVKKEDLGRRASMISMESKNTGNQDYVAFNS